MGGYESRACIAVFFFFFYSRCPRCDVSQQLHERKRVPYPLEKKKKTHTLSIVTIDAKGVVELSSYTPKRKGRHPLPSHPRWYQSASGSFRHVVLSFSSHRRLQVARDPRFGGWRIPCEVHCPYRRWALCPSVPWTPPPSLHPPAARKWT